MVKKFSDEEFIRLKDRLGEIAAQQKPAHIRLADELDCIAGSVAALNSSIDKNGFSDPLLEIDYYKNIYPTFQSLYMYQAGLYRLEASLPDWDRRSLKRFYREKQQRIREEVESEHIHYAYFKLGADDLDDLYFRRDPGRYSVLMPVLTDPLAYGSTPMSFLFARFRAAEMLYRHIEGQLEDLLPASYGKPRRKMQWTGPVINLIELAHGIHLSGQVNDGNIGIVEFFRLLGEFFGVNLGIPKKGFDDLNKRKRLSKTHFTDQLREVLLREMDEQDRWMPKS
ncbi:hypothetical protein CHU00_06655 [Sphingobacterium cellulitidis]|uniref:RteC domain-containing protein n=1 Tax=Sphingobacterium cellulitidis TaxID=1768011 RepID=UPI000B93F9EA|nr:RteC domain-containing protein [Sphingobacterium cellulitidis]OYD46365.1 hypothetical protein CHU00_06655 [Sphingobacterium cellulitidis]